ncbi:MAG TPA: DUF4097 family beta strand repeat-containing protein [Thermoanaerobaculia bacterium]|nr:DUF4097 family beta strand repeat-containing protein [Thermoanaerobaculia bacterium]
MRRALTALAAALAFWALAAPPASADAPQTRLVRESFPVAAGQPLRLANLAGRVDLVPGPGPQVVVEATVHAEGDSAAETRKLLAGMKWVRSHDQKGREEMALSYPVETYRGFHFPRRDDERSDLPEFLRFLADAGHTSTIYRGERIRIYPRRRSGVPTLYADLRISVPSGAAIAVHDILGAVRGEDLTGNVEVDTGSGDVRFGAFSGTLKVETGSGDIRLGSAKGETAVHTGSGDITVGSLVGNGRFETGSGDVVLDQVAAGKLTLDTGSGNVTIKAGTVAKIAAKTGSGNVRVSQVELEELVADTGSGDVTLQSSLAQARQVRIGTGSGDIRIAAGPQATFDLDSDQGSGDLRVGYADATLRKHGSKVVGARRGDGRTRIHIETGSGDCSILPKG